jgi:DNA-binding transcriptional MerR regulator
MEGFTIAQMAERTGLSAHTLRYYERAGLLKDRPPRDANGNRRYTQQDADWIRLLTKLRSTGMPIAGLRRYTDLARTGNDTAGARKELLQAHRAEVIARIEQLEADLVLIDYKIAIYEKFMEEQ